MSTWNYRLTKERHGDEVLYGIREVHYDADGKVKGWTKDIVGAAGDNPTEVVEALRRMIHQARFAAVIDVTEADGTERSEG